MIQGLKRKLYFVVARYFRFWAAIALRRWAPSVIVVTGSAGKTTLLHLIQSQLAGQADYSHHANSAYGIPLHILGLSGVTGSRLKWFVLAVAAPFAALRRPRTVPYYVAEVDADRPHEAGFLAALLKPNVTLWVSSLHTHATKFDGLVAAGRHATVEEAIAYEYGKLVAATRELAAINGDNPLMVAQAAGASAVVQKVSIKDLESYTATANGSHFAFGGTEHTVPALLPRNNYYQLAMVDALLAHLGQKPVAYDSFAMPPGRSNVFAGVRGSTIIDSTYNNANLDSLREIIEMFGDYKAPTKWAVIGDMLEQGSDEAREHQKLADVLNQARVDRLILIGPRIKQHTVPLLSAAVLGRTNVFLTPREVLAYLQQNLKPETPTAVLFKGVRFLEGVIEALLVNPADAAKLPRRGAAWQKRRKRWGV